MIPISVQLGTVEQTYLPFLHIVRFTTYRGQQVTITPVPSDEESDDQVQPSPWSRQLK